VRRRGTDAPTVSLRLSNWRECVAEAACRTCGAQAGRACSHGGSDVDCARCTRISGGCRHGPQVHVARFAAWMRPAVV
jgi:hypothetical protein